MITEYRQHAGHCYKLSYICTSHYTEELDLKKKCSTCRARIWTQVICLQKSVLALKESSA